MHTVLRVIVDASGEEQAVKAAERYFDRHLMVENGGKFDYANPMTDDGPRSAGANRWTEYQGEPNAFHVTSDRGQTEVYDAWNETKLQGREHIEAIYELCEASDSPKEAHEKFMSDENNCQHNIAGLYRLSTSARLFVSWWWADGVRTYRGWNYVTDYMDGDTEDSRELWVVPLDAHF